MSTIKEVITWQDQPRYDSWTMLKLFNHHVALPTLESGLLNGIAVFDPSLNGLIADTYVPCETGLSAPVDATPRSNLGRVWRVVIIEVIFD